MSIVLHTYTLNVPFFLKNVRHTGVEVFGKEYTFSMSGITICKPRKSKIGKYVKSYEMSEVQFSHAQFARILEILGRIYRPNTYNFIYKNCNHFCDDLLHLLCGRRLGYQFMLYSRLGKLLGQMKNSGIFCGASEESGFSKMDQYLLSMASQISKLMLTANAKSRSQSSLGSQSSGSCFSIPERACPRVAQRCIVKPKSFVNTSTEDQQYFRAYQTNSRYLPYSFEKNRKMHKGADAKLKSIYSISTDCSV